MICCGTMQVEHQLMVMEGLGCDVLGKIEELRRNVAEVRGT